MPKATIYHNPRCTKSSLTLQLLKDNDIEHDVVLYLKTPLANNEIQEIVKKLDISSVREIMRVKQKEYIENNLSEKNEDELYAAIVKHPILLERPIVVVGEKAAIGRPPENILKILDSGR